MRKLMALGRDDATRILRFCLAGDGWGAAATEDGACVVRLSRSAVAGGEVLRFEASTFEESLRQAVAAGALKAACVDKQIAFLVRSLADGPDDGGADAHGGEAGDFAAGAAAVAADVGGGGALGALGSTIFPSVASAVSALVNEAQRERGISSVFALSGGRLFGDELGLQWRKTDERLAELSSVFRRLHRRLPEAVMERLEDAEDLLGAATALRRAVELVEVAPAPIIDAYTEANGALLGVIDELTASGLDGEIRSAALAWLALLNAKEKTGLERAQLAHAFLLDRFADDGQYVAVSSLKAAQESYLHLFSAAAPRPADRLLRQKLASDPVNEVARMERIALVERRRDFGIDPTVWFAAMTRKMDFFSDVEAAVLRTIRGGEAS